jgi:hypothetical protein
MTAEEKNLIKAQTEQLGTISKILAESQAQGAEQQDIYKSLSGLYDENGNLDKTALATMKEKNAAYSKQAEEISSLQTERYLKALKGELPVSEATTQKKQQEFDMMREALARSGGGEITGDTPEGATGLSSAAIQNLGRFNTTFGLLEDQERRGELAAGGMGADPSSSGLNYLSSSYSYNPSSLLSGYSSLASGYGQAAQPYADQRMLQYQQQLQQASLNSRGGNPYAGVLGGAASGAAIGSAVPGLGTAWGAGIGAGMGLLSSQY